MKKSLGGDRLGSGKKMDVKLHGFERSTHDLGYIWRSTMSAGTLVPFMCEVALPGDTFDIFLDCDVKTHPTVAPLFGSFKVQLDTFSVPWRLYNSLIHNNALKIGRNMNQAKIPQIKMVSTAISASADVDNAQVNPSSLFAYLGIRGVGSGTAGSERYFNAIPYLGYWDIFKNYYANLQENMAFFIHSEQVNFDNENVGEMVVGATYDTGTTIPEAPATSTVQATDGSLIWINWVYSPNINSLMIVFSDGTEVPFQDIFQTNGTGGGYYWYQYNFGRWGTRYIRSWRYIQPDELKPVKPKLTPFLLENIDTMRTNILAFSSKTEPFVIDEESILPYGGPLVQKMIYETPYPSLLFSQEGLAVKTYQSDIFNNWLSTEWIDGANGISELTAIDTSEGSFTLDTLNLSKKVYDMLNRIAVSGGTYNDWLEVVYDHPYKQRAETPVYLGGLSRELVFQEVVSNATASSDEGIDPLGTLAGKGIMGKRAKGGKVVVRVDEPSFIMGIVSLTPRVDYSQGNRWYMNLQTWDDLHKPNLDQIGFQELITEQMAYWTTSNAGGVWSTKSAGKQPAWINYMTNFNRTYGNFAVANNEMFMTLNRRYESNVGIDILDLTTYIDPAKFNYIFAQEELDAQNFWVQIAVDITARRKMSAKVMPNM
ncbi:MAG: major capsid protein [Malazfec virus 4]